MSQRFAQRGARRRWPDFILVVFFLCLAILACNLPLGDRRQELNDGLYLAPRATDGTVSGSYHYPTSLKNKKVNFSVSAEGYATFQVEGAPASEQLTVSLLDENFAGMNWAGLTLDGYGDLNGEEQSVLQALGDSDLLHALSLIPLEAACQGEAQIEPQQMAALLFPLQMYFKYQVAERETVARELMALSNCMAPGDTDNPSARPLQVYMTAANPIPVVLGYFPFDAEGALERTGSGLPGLGQASLIPLSAAGYDLLMAAHAQAGLEPVGFFPVIRDQAGPCDAKCRGACGPDCTLNNCRLSADYRCEEDENGNNTGQISYLHIYDCGLHPACIKHDQCYDDCNQRYGCGTFKAAHCRHGGWNDGMNLPENYYCDKHTVHEESLSNVKGWVDGFGPQTIRQVFIYTDKNFSHLDDLENCPLPVVGPVEELPIPSVESSEAVTGEFYQGDVRIEQKPKSERAVLEILDSKFELEIIDGRLRATIEYTQFFTMREGGDQNGICNATFTRQLSGEGPMTNPVSIQVAVLSSEILSLEGAVCDRGDGWKTSAREDLLANLAKTSSFRLVGQFKDDKFEGSLEETILLLSATRVER